MQKYRPYRDFSSMGEALQYYKSFLNQIFEQGCADAAICNIIYHWLEETPDVFLKCFGFPMYEPDEYGNIDYNYEALMVDVFCNRLSKIPNGWEMMDQIIQKDMYKYELNRFMMGDEWTKKKPDNLSGKELEEWKEFEKKRDETFRELNKKYSDAKEVSYDLGIGSSNHESDISYYISSYLAEHYLDSGVTFPIDDIKPGDMIASRGFNFYTDENGNHDDLTMDEIGSHWFYITDVTRDGKIIASSWGKKYYFEPPKMTNFNKKYVMIVRVINISPNSRLNYR
jgi:hypothetical protein